MYFGKVANFSSIMVIHFSRTDNTRITRVFAKVENVKSPTIDSDTVFAN